MKSIETVIEQLSAEFPRDVVSWRAQTFKSDGSAALALAYIDARDVMNRLDEVCSPFGWASEHIVAGDGKKVTCKIGIKCPVTNEWVWKSDGAGETDVEGEKGSYSDSLKRAAVSWGVGRYLYAMDAVWCDCEAVKGANQKWVFKRWLADPWAKVKNVKPTKPATKPEKIFANAALRNQYVSYCLNAYADAATVAELNKIVEMDLPKLTDMRNGDEHDKLAAEEIYKQYKLRLENLRQKESLAASFNQGFNEIGAQA